MTDPIANLKLSRLGKADVRQFRDRQQELYSDATVVKRLNLLAAILNCAAREWDMPLPLNPASSTSVPRPAGADKKRTRRLLVPGPAILRAVASKGENPPMTEEEMLYTVLGTSGNEWDVWLTRWAVAQATRQGEALGLRWRDIDLDRKTFRVLGRDSKGTKNDQHREEIGPEIRPLMPGAIFILNAIKPAGGRNLSLYSNHSSLRVTCLLRRNSWSTAAQSGRRPSATAGGGKSAASSASSDNPSVFAPSSPAAAARPR
jgi:integrase